MWKDVNLALEQETYFNAVHTEVMYIKTKLELDQSIQIHVLFKTGDPEVDPDTVLAYFLSDGRSIPQFTGFESRHLSKS